MTRASEDREKTLAWVQDQGVEYPFAFAKDNKLYEVAGVKGIPHAALFNAKGEMVWQGSPYSLNNSTIKDALKGASKNVTFGWGKPYAKIAKSVIDGDYSKALKATDALVAKGTEGASDVRAAIVRKLDKKITAMEMSFKAGDYYAALVAAEALDGQIDGLDQAANVTSTLNALDDDDQIETILGGQKKLAKIMNGKLDKTKQIDSAIKKAKQIAKKYDGTIVETQAKDFVQRMRAKKSAKH